MQGTLVLTDGDKKDLISLNNFRNGLAHVKSRGWLLETAGLPRIFRTAAKAMRQLLEMAPLWLHLEEDEIERAEKSIDALAARPK